MDEKVNKPIIIAKDKGVDGIGKRTKKLRVDRVRGWSVQDEHSNSALDIVCIDKHGWATIDEAFKKSFSKVRGF